MSPYNILFFAHSGIRWLVVLATAVMLIYALIGFLTSRPYDRTAGIVVTIFTRLIEVQWLLGIIVLIAYLLTFGSIGGPQILHFVIMTIAVVAAHAYMGFRRRDDRMKYAGALLAGILTLVIVVIGVSVLGGNRWGMPAAPASTALVEDIR